MVNIPQKIKKLMKIKESNNYELSEFKLDKTILINKSDNFDQLNNNNNSIFEIDISCFK